MKVRTIALLALSAAVFCALPESEAEAQRAYVAPRGRFGVAIFPPGMYFGGGLVGTKVVSQHGGNELLEDGAGFTLFTGIRLNPRLALEAGWIGSLHNPEEVDTAFGSDVDFLVLNGLTGDAKVFFAEQGSATPYAQAGLGLYLIDSEYFGAQAIGSGFQLGGGFDFSLGHSVDLGLRALYRGISMGPPERADDDTFISAVTAEANLTLHF